MIVGIFFLFLYNGNCEDVYAEQTSTKIRVVNNSEFYFTGVSLFSMNFDNLKPGDSSSYKLLKYDPLKDDSLIYCIAEGYNYGRYLKLPDKEFGNYTYQIDSVKSKILYVSLHSD